MTFFEVRLAWHNPRVSRRFQPTIKTPGLEEALRLRTFAGFHPEDALACRVATWTAEGLTTVLISPRKGATGSQLAVAFEQIANHFMLELVVKRQASFRSAVRWVQHWPAREGAPAPRDDDHFENVQLRPADGRLTVEARQLVAPADALRGLLPPFR